MKKIFAILLAVVLVIFATVPAFAVKSPGGDKEFDVTINTNQGGTGSFTTEVVGDDNHILLKADPLDGFKFSHWIINGDYVIISGSLTDADLVIMPLGDVVATPYFEKDGEVVPGEPVTPDDGNKSPATGDVTTQVMAIVGLLSVALFGAVATKKALSK